MQASQLSGGVGYLTPLVKKIVSEGIPVYFRNGRPVASMQIFDYMNKNKLSTTYMFDTPGIGWEILSIPSYEIVHYPIKFLKKSYSDFMRAEWELYGRLDQQYIDFDVYKICILNAGSDIFKKYIDSMFSSDGLLKVLCVICELDPKYIPIILLKLNNISDILLFTKIIEEHAKTEVFRQMFKTIVRDISEHAQALIYKPGGLLAREAQLHFDSCKN